MTYKKRRMSRKKAVHPKRMPASTNWSPHVAYTAATMKANKKPNKKMNRLGKSLKVYKQIHPVPQGKFL